MKVFDASVFETVISMAVLGGRAPSEPTESTVAVARIDWRAKTEHVTGSPLSRKPTIPLQNMQRDTDSDLVLENARIVPKGTQVSKFQGNSALRQVSFW